MLFKLASLFGLYLAATVNQIGIILGIKLL